MFGAFSTQERWWRSRAFVAGLVTAVVFTATALISYAIAPDWMWMYFIAPRDASWVVPLIGPSYLFVFATSFAAAIGLRAAGKRWVWAAAATTLVMEIAVVAITWERYHLVGTRSEWLQGVAHELFSASPSGPARTIGLLGPVFVVTLVVCLFLSYRGSRREAAAG